MFKAFEAWAIGHPGTIAIFQLLMAVVAVWATVKGTSATLRAHEAAERQRLLELAPRFEVGERLASIAHEVGVQFLRFLPSSREAITQLYANGSKHAEAYLSVVEGVPAPEWPSRAVQRKAQALVEALSGAFEWHSQFRTMTDDEVNWPWTKGVPFKPYPPAIKHQKLIISRVQELLVEIDIAMDNLGGDHRWKREDLNEKLSFFLRIRFDS